MTQNQVETAPENGTKPRPAWRVNRARIGVLAAVLGIMAAFMCLAVIAPPTVDAASWEDAVLAGAVSGGIVGGVAGSVVPGLGTGLGGLIGIGIGATAAGIGWLIGEWGGDTDAGAAALAKWLANDQRNQTVAKLELGKANAENVGELAQRAITYYERSAYYAAVSLYEHQTEHDQAHTYDSDYVLDKAHVSDEMVGSVAGSSAVYNKIFRQLDSIGAGYIGDYSKNSVTIGANTYAGSKASSITYENQQYVRIVSYCNTPAGKYVWLNATDTMIMWNLGTSTTSGNVIITDPAGVTVYSEDVTLAASGGYALDLATIGLESGRYNVALPQSGWVWTANAAEDYANSGTVAPGIAIYGRNDNGLVFSWGWAMLPADQGFSSSGMWLFYSNYPWKATGLRDNVVGGGYPFLQFNYPDGTKTASAPAISLKPIIESIWNVSRDWRQINYAASLAGQTAYQVLIDNGGTGTDGMDPDVLYPPTYIVMPDYDQLGKMTAQELLSVYYAYLTQLNDTFQHSTIMEPESINISTGSFDLLIRGTVWYNGTQILGNSTPFTLYTTLEGVTLRAGENVSLTSAAYIITWADGYSSLTEYINAKGNVQNPNITYMDVGEGWTIHIDEISFENEIVEEKELTVDTLDTYVPPDLPDLTGPPSGTDVGNAATACVIVICAGAVLFIVGIVIENNIVAGLGIVAAVVAAAAWYVILNPIDIGFWSLANVPEYLTLWWRAT